MTVKMKFEGGIQGLREKIKGTSAKEENEREREKLKGADSATMRTKMHEGENNM